MAELGFRPLYGFNYFENQYEGISLQFHITSLCDQICKHCYINKSSDQETLDLKQMKNLIEEFANLAKHYKITPSIAITGGDPILSPYFWDILEYLKNINMPVVIMGNSYHIDNKVVKKLKNYNVNAYQISIDGLKEKHDYIRKPGSFDDALRALKLIHDNGILATVMYTISPINFDALLPLYIYLNDLHYIDTFGFDRMIPIGNAKNITDNLIDINDYKNLMFKLYKFQIVNKPRLLITMKDNLWKLFLYDLGLINPINNSIKGIKTGCFAGINSLSVSPDGTMHACRRLDISIGKYPEKSFYDIYKYNDLIKEILNIDLYEGCNNCEIRSYCRGCLAMKYAVNKNIHSKDPNCWRCNSVR